MAAICWPAVEGWRVDNEANAHSGASGHLREWCVKLSAMATTGHVAVFYAQGNEAWAACLMADLAAHGVRVLDATRE